MPGGGGSSPAPAGNTTTVQKSDPWEGQQPYLKTGFAEAQKLFDAGGPQYYPDQTYAGPTDAMNQALQKQINLASGGNPLTQASTDAAMARFSPDYLTSNPGNAYYQSMGNGPELQAAIQSAVSQATPGLLDTFTQGNRLNSPGAAYAVSQGITNAAAPVLMAGKQAAAQGISNNYNTAGQQQNQAMLLAPELQSMPYNDISQLYSAGQQQQGNQQATINDAMAKYNYEQTQPFNLLDWYNASVGGSFGGTSTLTSPYFQQQGGGLGGLGTLGGALAGGLTLGPLGAIGGGLLGSMF